MEILIIQNKFCEKFTILRAIELLTNLLH